MVLERLLSFRVCLPVPLGGQCHITCYLSSVRCSTSPRTSGRGRALDGLDDAPIKIRGEDPRMTRSGDIKRKPAGPILTCTTFSFPLVSCAV